MFVFKMTRVQGLHGAGVHRLNLLTKQRKTWQRTPTAQHQAGLTPRVCVSVVRELGFAQTNNPMKAPVLWGGLGKEARPQVDLAVYDRGDCFGLTQVHVSSSLPFYFTFII